MCEPGRRRIGFASYRRQDDDFNSQSLPSLGPAYGRGGAGGFVHGNRSYQSHTLRLRFRQKCVGGLRWIAGLRRIASLGAIVAMRPQERRFLPSRLGLFRVRRRCAKRSGILDVDAPTGRMSG